MKTAEKITENIPTWQVLFLLLPQGRKPAETSLYAEHDRRPDGVGLVLLRVPPPPPAADLQITHRGLFEWRKPQSKDSCMCVHIYVCVCVWRHWGCLFLQLWSTILSENQPSLKGGSVKRCRGADTRRWCNLALFQTAESAYKRRNLEEKFVMIITSGITWISVYSYRTMLSNWGIVPVQMLVLLEKHACLYWH